MRGNSRDIDYLIVFFKDMFIISLKDVYKISMKDTST